MRTEIGVAALVSLLLAASKSLSSDNITVHAVSYVSRFDVTTVEIFRLSQKPGLRGVVAV